MSPESEEEGDKPNPADREAGEMGRRRALADAVGTDLSRDERETGVEFFESDGRFTIYSYSPTIVRSILRHGEASINWVYVDPPHGRKRREESLGEIPNDEATLKIEGLSASLPLSTLSIKGSPRSYNKPSGIVSTPDQAERVADAFADGGSE